MSAAAGDDGRTGPPPRAAAPPGEDLILDLQHQLASALKRVEELERANETLLSRLSRCRCSQYVPQEEGPRASLHKELRTADIRETVINVSSESSDHSIICSSNQHGGDGPANGSDESCAKHVKHKLREEPGRDTRSIHHHAKRYVALKVMYFGQRFYGFASEAQMDPTIESEIFEALKRTRLLVGSKENSHYSRCGRTDKGVSSTGQVISLYLRSNLKDVGEYIKDKNYLTEKPEEEIDYVRVLNRVLPKDIRVIGWCPAPTAFHARFSCLSREYRLCRVQLRSSSGSMTLETFVRWMQRTSNDNELWAITLRGSAFLWHQVRCMVAVLFMIGQGLESSDILDLLLDTSKTPRKPQFNMASELPLILRYCEFEDLNFICSSDARQALYEHLNREFHTYMLQAAIFYEALSSLSIPGPSEMCKKKTNHIPLLQRPTEPSYEERVARLKTKASNKSQSSEPHKQFTEAIKSMEDLINQ